MTEFRPEPERGTVSGIFDEKFIQRGIDPAWRLQRALERANVLMTDPDISKFEASVRALLGDLPRQIKVRALSRQKEFNTYEETPMISYFCGVAIMEYDKDDNPIPPPTVKTEITDYEKLFEIIKEELEVGGASWRYSKKRINVGEVETELPKSVINIITENLVDLLSTLRRDGHRDLSFQDMVASQRGLKPPTPSFEYESEKNEDE